VKRQERSGGCSGPRSPPALVHDPPPNPIQNVGNNTTFLLRQDLDAESRQEMRRAASSTAREDDDHQALPRRPPQHRQAGGPIERHEMDVNGAVAEIMESMRARGERNGIMGPPRGSATRDLWISTAIRFAHRPPCSAKPDHERDSGDQPRAAA